MSKSKLLDIDAIFDGFEIDEVAIKQATAHRNATDIRNGRGEYSDSKKISESIKQKYQDPSYVKKHKDANATRAEFMRNKIKTDEHKAKVRDAQQVKIYQTPKGLFTKQEMIAAYPDIMWQTLWARCTNNTHGFSKVKK